MLGDIAGRTTMLDVACSRCERRGRLSVARLALELGLDAPVRKAWQGLNADCPMKNAVAAGERCDLHAPDLPRLMGLPGSGAD